MPFAFNVVTKAIVWELNSVLIEGDMTQYVDDGFVASLDEEEDDDVAITLTFLRDLLGPDAVAIHKLERTPAFDFLGYNASITTGLMTISERNIHKAIFAFGGVDLTPGVRIKVKVMQCLASLGARYGAICRHLKPYTRILFRTFRTGRGRFSILLSAGERAVVRTFRNLFILIGLKGFTFSRTFESFDFRPHTWVCEFDASLTGIGIMWLRVRPDGSEEPIAYASVDISCLGFGEDASFQNTAEYLASLLCARGLAMLGAAGEPVLLRGDSKSALAWARKGSVRSDLAIKTGALWTQHSVVNQTDVVATVHLSHVKNSRTDIISRHGSWAEVVEEDGRHYGGRLPTYLRRLNLRCGPLLRLIDPSKGIDTEESFNAFFQAAMSFCGSSQGAAQAHELQRKGGGGITR